MKHSWLSVLRSAPLRLSPGFRVTPLAEVRAFDRHQLSAGARESEWAAALVPTAPGWRRVQLIDRETLALLEQVRLAMKRLPRSASQAAARLLLDGVLELDWNGTTVSGPAAHELCFPDAAAVGKSRIARLSLEALHYAAALGIQKPRVLAERLYRYNSVPASPQWRRRLPDTDAVQRWLAGGAPRAPRGWSRFVSAEPGAPVWEVWERRGAPSPAADAPTYKLYLSPHAAGVGEASRALRALPAGCAPFAFKLGGDLVTLLRSEKLVAYYTGLAALQEGADRLRVTLRGLPAQGVPFTVALDGSGLLSWGADPGDRAEPPGPLRQTSWRRWITARLGNGVASALAAGAPVPAWRYAIDRVSLEGVDPRRWTPPAWFWNPRVAH